MTATVHYLPVTVDTAILTCTARAEREGREPIDVAKERMGVALGMVAVCGLDRATGDRDEWQQQAEAYAAAITYFICNRNGHAS